MRKIIHTILITLFLIAATSSAVFANDTSDSASSETTVKRYSSCIWDEEDLLTDEEEQKLLEEYMAPITEYGNAIMYTTRLSNGTDFEKHAEDTYYATFGNEPGVLFQIDMGNRELTLSCSTGMEEFVGRERSSIVDNIYTYATDGDYFTCCALCFSQIEIVLHNGDIAHTMKYIDNALLAVILALVLNFVLIFVGSTKKKNISKVLLKGSVVSAVVASTVVSMGRKTKKYDPVSSGSSGSGGGGGGGGFSGGSSSHGF